jgi:1-acyl-sn-glycerol-3-phosphate acyltransferase
MKRFRRAINWYGMAIISSPYPFIKLRYENLGKDGSGKPYIIVCNHRSASDAFLMGILPHELVQIVNVWPFRIPVLGAYAKLAGYLNIRMIPTDEFLQSASNLLKDGVSIVFFPEGTRSTSGKMGSFHGSAFRLALQSKAAIVPLCITGSENIPPKGSPLLHPGIIKIRRLPAIEWDEYKHLTAFALKNRVWKIIDNELSTMES